MKHILSPEDLANAFHLADDTMERMRVHLDLLRHWQHRINLVAGSTLNDPWRRHVLDSLQLLPLLPETGVPIVDLGSGAGFPGLVLALATGRTTVLIEADSRKASFLREAIRRTAAPAKVLNARIETLDPIEASIMTARAFAPLSRLFEFAHRHITSSTTILLLKGKSVDAELTDAMKTWKMTYHRVPSQSDASGVVLEITDLKRRDANTATS